ncbi:MAG: RecQ family ATP-dependent DNA helicase [Verrucomicrobiaceae bacterium]|nr:MAG: RecQ family ATP-dependent DNA helicase [Verrucomicrobiaceae bacterium]
MSAAMLQTLRDHFGFDAFRGGQEPVIRALLDGRPALAVFPTGGGKSLCYQLPALLLDGLTLVISPLIALMKDQVDALTAKGIAAARLDSTLGMDELRELYENLESGAIKLLYIAPERLANEAFRKRIKQLNVAMIAIDEAHCISEWGHNFRPDYLKLARFSRSLKVSRVLALTATATPKVAREIRRHFRIAAADHIQLSFHRPNLDLRVTPCKAAERKSILLDRLAAIDGAAVVYVTRQETAEEVATFLAKQGVSARAYHAGLPDEFRADAQRAFMAGETRVIVATIAFGMGIDKADIRGVIHYNLPKSLENHTQEIGRAGRDGQPAICELLACGDDLIVLENFIYSDTPSPRALGNLIDRVLRLGEVFDISVYDLSVTCDIRTSVISTLLAYLETEGILEATGIFYGKYRIKLLRSRDQVLAGFPAAEKKFLSKLLDLGTPGRMWLSFEPSVLAGEMGVSRAKIVAALAALESAGDATVTVSGVRQGYRMKTDPGDLHLLTARHAETFRSRELADLDRLRQVLGISSHRGCLTGYLTKHFGEALPTPCGHCDRCRGVPATTIKRPPTRKPSDEEWRLVRKLSRENHAELTTPRQLARFLCGMSSPASTRARLSRHNAFGLLADLPFADVLAIAEAI